jgi:radical SAM-linked protein
MGVESEEEFIDLELSEHLPAAEVGARLNAELPRGFTIQWAEAIDLRTLSIDASIAGFQYTVALHSLPATKQAPAFLAGRLSAYHAAASVPIHKHTRNGGKMVDAKQFVNVALSTPQTLTVELRVTKAGTIKPHDFVRVLLELAPEEADFTFNKSADPVSLSTTTGLPSVKRSNPAACKCGLSIVRATTDHYQFNPQEASRPP